MLDIKNLERRWLKYKIKSLSPYILIFFLSLSLLSGVSLWLTDNKPSHQNSLIAKNPVPSPQTAEVPPIPNVDENITVLEPSMDFVQSFQNIPAPTEMAAVSQPTTVLIKQPVQQQQPIQQQPAAPKTLIMPEYKPSPAVAPVSKTVINDKALSINRNESKLEIDDLLSRFKETSNANLGLFIARYYYEHGNFNESYNYALKTNNINNRIDESWILFAKSLMKLGKTDQAKKTLQLYISQSNSENARSLLDSIEKGNFK
ncbi:tetratricopeptide repeat protein [Sulfuricurvum sp.]|uniref:tetratricopeptide repeat protein n=1 Tax=Sulfuricurvum sp. TaxID=2025608 RepID=UPI003BB219CD